MRPGGRTTERRAATDPAVRTPRTPRRHAAPARRSPSRPPARPRAAGTGRTGPRRPARATPRAAPRWTARGARTPRPGRPPPGPDARHGTEVRLACGAARPRAGRRGRRRRRRSPSQGPELLLRPVEVHRGPARRPRARAAAPRPAPGGSSPAGHRLEHQPPARARVVRRGLADPRPDLEERRPELHDEGPGRAAALADVDAQAGRERGANVGRIGDLPGQPRPDRHSSSRSGASPMDANPSRSYRRSAGRFPLHTPRYA